LPTENHKKILIAPLDWGLGHTTRCLPLIDHLAAAGHHITVAGNERQRNFIRANTHYDIDLLPLGGYDVHYNKPGRSFSFALLRQIPKIHSKIRSEHEWLLQQVAVRNFDGIISDNRYGLFHPEIPSVIMTHQLQLHTPGGATVAALIRELHYRYLGKFDNIWVPDVKGEHNLSGKLGYPKTLPPNVHYIGLLSHLAKYKTATEKDNYVLVLLSGPEPQRSILSTILWEQTKQFDEKIVFVEGSDMAAQPNHIPENIHYYKQAGSELLRELLANASIVICRSGYSTLMDLAALGKKAIIIPTPGQTEQEYLGRYLHEKKIFYCVNQKNINLRQSIDAAASFPFVAFADEDDNYNKFPYLLDKWVETL
jgi:UDP:flavonoid glycosyltransferase YjiC (YdhE family)